jgi:hypothetical protein
VKDHLRALAYQLGESKEFEELVAHISADYARLCERQMNKAIEGGSLHGTCLARGEMKAWQSLPEAFRKLSRKALKDAA